MCPSCRRSIVSFQGVDEGVEAELVEYIRSGQTVSAIKRLREVSGRGLDDSRWMIQHMYGLAGVAGRAGAV
jgi:hypothetical protein